MSGMREHTGVVVPLRIDNVDTDQIIPSREMKTVSKQGLGQALFAGWRYESEDGTRSGDNPDFVLNRQRYEHASVLLGGRNFGCGSSREHAVWALADYGFRVIIAESFGRIFKTNCGRNRILAIELEAEEIDRIEADTADDPQQRRVRVDLEQCRIQLPDAGHIDFSVDEFDRRMLVRGLDYVGATLEYEKDIDAFRDRDRLSRPWAYL